MGDNQSKMEGPFTKEKIIGRMVAMDRNGKHIEAGNVIYRTAAGIWLAMRVIRRFIVGLSRGRKGVYILGRFELFKNCYEMENIMNKFTTSQNLMISIDDDNYIKVEDFRHMYRIVQELIGKKINELSI